MPGGMPGMSPQMMMHQQMMMRQGMPGMPPLPPSGMPPLPPGVAPPPLPTDDGPASKKQRLDDGAQIDESAFVSMHPGPVKISVRCEPELGGQVITLDMPVTMSIKAVKDALTPQLNGMAANKQKLSRGGVVLKDASTLAYYNIAAGVELSLSAKTRGGA
jgi:hypothetical protein